MNHVRLSRGAIVFLVVLSFAAIYFSVFMLGVRSTGSVLQKGVHIWRSELAKAVVEEKWLLVDRIVRALCTPETASLQMMRESKVIFSYPEADSKTYCAFPSDFEIEHYGVNVGQVRFCQSLQKQLIFTARSPIFISLLLGALFLMFFIKSVTLQDYKKALLHSFKLLEQWARDPKNELQSVFSKHKKSKFDPQEQELIKFVQDGTSARLQAERALAQGEKSQELATLAAQVAHDIRSPLAALGAAEKGLNALPEEERVLIRTAVARIRDIAQQLLNKNRQLQQEQQQQFQNNNESISAEPFSVEQVQVLIEQILGEKRMQYRDRRDLALLGSWDKEAYQLFARVQPVEFQRLLSNLINNAVEALPPARPGKVSVSLQSGPENSMTISVVDNGSGISPEILPRLMQKGATFGKAGGSGLGLHHAKVTAERWTGQLRVVSEPGQGTTVILHLPCAPLPPWFVSGLGFPPASWIIALDDDPSVHAVWKGRFQSLGVSSQKISVCHFKAPGELADWVNQNPMLWDQALYLVDHDLSDSKRTGLDVIQELGIQSLSVLVTSRAVEGAIRQRCEKIGVKLLPKELAAQVPMRLISQQACITARCM